MTPQQYEALTEDQRFSFIMTTDDDNLMPMFAGLHARHPDVEFSRFQLFTILEKIIAAKHGDPEAN